MAENAVASVLEKFVPFLQDELQLWRDGGQEILSGMRELERMTPFLNLADALEDTHKDVKVWVKQLRDAAHEIENVLDEYRLLLAHNHGGGLSGLFHKWSCCIKNRKARWRAASEIRSIRLRIKDICEGHDRLHQIYCSSSSSSSNTWHDARGDALLLLKGDLVGIEEHKEKLIRWLLNSIGRQVMSLTGMGGSGKTALAKQVYDDPQVKRYFTAHAWITFSRTLKIEEILKDMTQKLHKAMRKRVPKAVDSMNRDGLILMIKNLLQNKRYLIVLDDVWCLNEWDAIKYVFPINDCGSRVLITTRNTELASTSCIEFNGDFYILEPLSSEDSWTLFCKKTFPGSSCPDYLENICRSILKRCEGLPLAIVAISGLLSTKDTLWIDQWERVGRSLGAEIEGNGKLQNLNKVLSLSINDLPQKLKCCFLYFSIFPQDYLVDHTTLIRLWVAEGFVEEKEGKTAEEVAEDYFNELLNRSLIQAVGLTSDGRIRTCRIHEFLREIVISKSRELDFAAIAKNQTAIWPEKVRRLSIHNTLQNVQKNRCASPMLRSLFMFRVLEKPNLHEMFPEGFMLLTVLDLRAAPLTKFPMHIVNLFHLRYLSLRETKIKFVPTLVWKLENLETLDLKNSDVTELPVETLKLQRLRHLLVYKNINETDAHFHSVRGFKNLENIGDLKCLQKLYSIEVDQGNGAIVLHLGRLTQLRRLGITNLRREDGENLCSSIQNLTSLHSLSIISKEEDEIIDLQHQMTPPPLLQRISLTGKLEKMPHWIPSVLSLVKVSLKYSRLKDDPLVFLQDLPNLLHIELYQVYDGEILCFMARGFKKLRLLGIHKFTRLKCIQVKEGAMPCLEKLSICCCNLLERMPLDIEHLTKLKVLELFGMPWIVAHMSDSNATFWRDRGRQIFHSESSIERGSSLQTDTVISS